MKKGDLVWVRDSTEDKEVLRIFAETSDLILPFRCYAYPSSEPATPENVRESSNTNIVRWKYCRPYTEPLKRGDLVWVGDTVKEVKDKHLKRVFLADVGGRVPIVTVSDIVCNLPEQSLLYNYAIGDYKTTAWKYCEKVTEEPAKEYTVAEIEKLLGHPVKIVGEKA